MTCGTKWLHIFKVHIYKRIYLISNACVGRLGADVVCSFNGHHTYQNSTFLISFLFLSHFCLCCRCMHSLLVYLCVSCLHCMNKVVRNCISLHLILYLHFLFSTFLRLYKFWCDFWSCNLAAFFIQISCAKTILWCRNEFGHLKIFYLKKIAPLFFLRRFGIPSECHNQFVLRAQVRGMLSEAFDWFHACFWTIAGVDSFVVDFQSFYIDVKYRRPPSLKINSLCTKLTVSSTFAI